MEQLERQKRDAVRWCRMVAAGAALLLAGLIALVAVVDPYEIYHMAWFYTPSYRSETQSYSNAGVAKSYEYDSVIIGSSVTENCMPSVYEEALGGSFVKLCMNGGMARDHAKMMEIAFRTHRVKRVVYGVDVFAYTSYYTNQKMLTPDYLYDANLFNDVSYWFNRDVLMTEIPYAFSNLGERDAAAERDWMYAWTPPEMPDPASLRVKVEEPGPEQIPDRNVLVDGNIEYNLLSFITAHPETEFDLFFPPYTLSYWRNLRNHGELVRDLACRDRIIEAVAGLPNVHLYDFAVKEDWITDYSHYYDYRHYTREINDAMAFAMADGEEEIHSAAEGLERTKRLEQMVMDASIP